MKTYIAFLLALLLGASIGTVWGYQQGLQDGANITAPAITLPLPHPPYICPPEDSPEDCPDPIGFIILQDFGPV